MEGEKRLHESWEKNNDVDYLFLNRWTVSAQQQDKEDIMHQQKLAIIVIL